jgi:hypothetical protein
MLSLRTDKWVRVGCGLGILLLLAAQEQFCPWLSNPPQQQPGADPPPGAAKKPNKRPKPDLSLVLRDTPPLSKPAAWAQTTLRQTIGDRDGVVSSGLRNPPVVGGASLAVGAVLPGWHDLQTPLATGSVIKLRDSRVPPPHPAVYTCITRTGPPRA